MTMKAMVCHFVICQTPSRYTKAIVKNMEQILGVAFLNNDIVITLHSTKEEGIPYFNWCQRLH
jgi:hypothetical protein